MDFGLMSLGDHLAAPGTRLVSQSASGRHRTIVESAVHAEQAGFASVAIGEHHFCDYIVSSPPVVLGAIAARTRRIRLNTAVTLLANLDPVRVAEDYATVDALSDGRVELTVGRGILEQTYQAFGQEWEESRAVFREKLELLLRLWSEDDVDWCGQTRPPLKGVTVQPRPTQQPHPTVWLGGGSSAESVDLAAELGLPLMLPSVLSRPEIFAPLVARYRERWAGSGWDPERARVGACGHVHVRRDSQNARAFWKPYYENYFGFVTRLIGALGPPEARAALDVDVDALFESVPLSGSPAEVGERLAASREALGLDLFLTMFDLGGLPEGELFDTITLFAEQVMPQAAG